MKLLSYILLVSFTLLILTPIIFIHKPVVKLVCKPKTDCCMAKEDNTCDMDNMKCCPEGMCSPTQCVFCCFLCPVANDKIVIRNFDSGLKIKPTADSFLLSGFTSECWQPPELT